MKYYSHIAGSVALFAPMAAHAIVPSTPCTGLVGCGQGAANIIMNNATPFADLMLQVATGLSVLFIVWAGFNMIIAMGDDSKISQFKWGILYSMLGLGIALVSQVLVSFVSTHDYNLDSTVLPVGLIGAAVSILLNLMNVAFVCVIILGGVRMVYAQGKSDEFNKGKSTIVWAIGGAVVINIANALVQAFIGLLNV